MLGMAAELHDRMVCSCGCGQWRADARDPDKKDRWQVEWDTCFVRRAINAEVDATDPPKDAVMSVRLLPEGVTAGADEYAELMARFPALRQAKNEPDRSRDKTADHDDDREQQ